jgi:MFS transporter, PPP family, 3-phenylpropionic acid transporter
MQHLPYWRLSAYYFAYFAFIGVYSPYFGLYLQSLSFSAWDIGLLMSLVQLTRVCGPYLWGLLADRCGQRLLIVRLSGVAALIAFAAFFFISRFAVVMAAMAAFSIFWAASLPLVEALTFDHLRDNPARYSRIRLWGSIGFIIVVQGCGALLDRLSMVAVLWVGSAALCALALCSLRLPEAVPHAPTAAGAAFGEVLRQPRVRALLAASFAMAAAHGTFNIFYSIFLAAHGYSKALVGALFSLGVLAEIAVFFYMSRALRRFSLRAILLACFAVAVVRFVLVGWGVASLALMAATQLMHGLTFGAFHSAAITAVNRWFGGATRSRGQALYSSLSFGAGGLLGGLVSGWTWDRLGGAQTFALSSLYALVGLLLVAIWIDAVGETGASRVRG